jgi:hypothetical protein
VAHQLVVVTAMATEAGLGDDAPNRRVAILRRKSERQLVHRHETRYLHFLNLMMRSKMKTETETGKMTTTPPKMA